METLYKNIYQDIIDRCRQGERQAQTQLYKIYYKSMYNVSLRLIGNETDAEDVMQEAFLNAFRKIDSYEGKVSFGAWLKKIVINRSLDHLKKKKIHFEEINDRLNIADEPIWMEMEQEKLENLRDAMKKLPEKYRVIINLFLVEGFGHDEIAEMLQISNSSSRILFFRAKQKLKELLQQNEIFSMN